MCAVLSPNSQVWGGQPAQQRLSTGGHDSIAVCEFARGLLAYEIMFRVSDVDDIQQTRRLVMNKKLKAFAVISLAMIVSSTPGFALDRTRDAQAANARSTAPHNARAEGRYIPDGGSSLTP